VERFNQDSDFVKTVGRTLIALHDDQEPATEKRLTMEDVKQLMGGRCFLPEEIGDLLGLQPREVAGIPKLTGRQIEQLMTFLNAPCPITGKVPAAETHILFPQPSAIGGATLSLEWVLKNAMRRWAIEFGGSAFDRPIPDKFHNQVRNSQWLLMFWGIREESAIPDGIVVDQLYNFGYNRPDLAIYTLALGYLKLRGTNIRPREIYGHGVSAILSNDLYACRTIAAGLNVYRQAAEGATPALVLPVPLR
jgi:hypothetical protein